MANVTYVNFKRGLRHPKLSWMIMMLNQFGIAHRMASTTSGPMLQVQQGSVEIASEILNQELVTFIASDKNNDASVPVSISVTIDDLPDDHEFFAAQLEGKAVTVPEAVVDRDERPTSDKITEAIVAGQPEDQEDDEDEDEGLTWDDIDDEDEDEDDEDEDEDGPASNVIDITAKVKDAGSDPEFEADDAPPKPPKERKKKAQPKEAVDPDFDTATTEGDLSAPVDGKEFLTVDETLAFEDVTFPDVKDPIRMYDVDSSTLSAVGAKILTTDPLVVTFYARFKSGATVYRYNPVARADWNTQLNLAIRRHKGIQEASGGSFFHHTIKVKADEGIIKCQRLTDEGKWVHVLPKSERTKQTKNRDK